HPAARRRQDRRDGGQDLVMTLGIAVAAGVGDVTGAGVGYVVEDALLQQLLLLALQRVARDDGRGGHEEEALDVLLGGRAEQHLEAGGRAREALQLVADGQQRILLLEDGPQAEADQAAAFLRRLDQQGLPILLRSLEGLIERDGHREEDDDQQDQFAGERPLDPTRRR